MRAYFSVWCFLYKKCYDIFDKYNEVIHGL